MKSFWADENVEKLIRWMVSNRELLRESTSTLGWTHKAKEDLFKDDSEIDTRKVKAKYHNMKHAWKLATAFMEQSGWSGKEEDCTPEMNGTKLLYTTALLLCH